LPSDLPAAGTAPDDLSGIGFRPGMRQAIAFKSSYKRLFQRIFFFVSFRSAGGRLARLAVHGSPLAPFD
jgi:hypothetical protein